MVELDRTSFFIPRLIILMICIGVKSMANLAGHPPAHVPHWMHSRIFSPPGSFMTSLRKSFPNCAAASG